MSLPGTTVTLRDQPPPRSAPLDTGTLFLCAPTTHGAATTELCASIADFETNYGTRAEETATWDYLHAFFNEGGSRCYIVPLVPDVSGPDTGVYDSLAAGAPVSLGPGQVAAVDTADVDVQTGLMQHAAETGRLAIVDPIAPDAGGSSVLAEADALLTATGVNDSIMVAPAATIPAYAGSAREVPYSAIQAGIFARNDAAGISPNEAAAGELGQARYATGLTFDFSDAERLAFNAGDPHAGVVPARVLWGGVRTYGNITIGADAAWSPGAARIVKAISAKANEIGERFVFSQLDGKRVTCNRFGSALSAMLTPYFEAGSLFGETAADAFRVDVGPTVNTGVTLAAGELRAVLLVRTSPFAERVSIEIVKVAVTDSVA